MDGFRISYMGTKEQLAPTVAISIGELPPGPVLDLFAGMSAIGKTVRNSRQLWANDVQPFAAMVGRVLFKYDGNPPAAADVIKLLAKHYTKNCNELTGRYSNLIQHEETLIHSHDSQFGVKECFEYPYVGSDMKLEHERSLLSASPSTFPYRLASLTYQGSFFGVRQCIEIDSLRYAIDEIARLGLISGCERERLIVGLGGAMCRLNNGTGQFANYLSISTRNYRRVISQRRRSIHQEFVKSIDRLTPIGGQSWRKHNRSFELEALDLLHQIRTRNDRPSVVYCDPPYSNAQYSRYYHVLDVLVRYDYPTVTGHGRYCTGRFQTPFALKSKVNSAMQGLVSDIAEIDCDLVLSYPSNGLFRQCGGSITGLLKQYFPRVKRKTIKSFMHSTFGGARVPSRVSVDENLYVASRR